VIYYHGTPITPDTVCASVLRGRHGLVSYAHKDQIELVAEVCSSFVIDNGAFSFWRAGKEYDFTGYAEFVRDWAVHPGFAWAIIPDIIDGTEEENDALICDCPFVGVPVWHLHESLDRLDRLSRSHHTVALGSSGEWSTPGTGPWWARMSTALAVVCGDLGRPRCKLHGLRMARPEIVARVPFASVDSTNIARNIGIDSAWCGTYTPPTKAARAEVLAARIESNQGAARWQTINDLPLFAAAREM